MLLDHLVGARKQGRRHIYKGDGLVSFVPILLQKSVEGFREQ